MINTWLIRSEFDQDPGQKTVKYSVMDSFAQENFISIDYPLITSSLEGKSRDELMQLLKDNYSHFTDRQFLLHLNTLYRMATEARIGDHIVVTDGNYVHFGKIESNYIYNTDSGRPELAHRRQVTWLQGPIAKKALPKKISDSLRAPISFSSLSHLTDSVIAYLNNEDIDDHDSDAPAKQNPTAAIFEENENMRIFTYPIRLDQQAAIQIPCDITQNEASRLADFVRTLYFN